MQHAVGAGLRPARPFDFFDETTAQVQNPNPIDHDAARVNVGFAWLAETMSLRGTASAIAPSANITGKHTITYRGSTVCNCVSTAVRTTMNAISNANAGFLRLRQAPTNARTR